MDISVWVTHHRGKKGHLAGRFNEDVVSLLGRSQRAEAARQAMGNRYLNEGQGGGGVGGGKRGSGSAGRDSNFPELEQAEVAPLYFVPVSTWLLDTPIDGRSVGWLGGWVVGCINGMDI